MASIMLSDFGVEHLCVERHPGTAIAPKAHIINPRTIEVFAQHGFGEQVYEDGSPRANNATTRMFTSLGGDRPWEGQNFHTISSWAGRELEDYYRTLTPYPHGNWQQNRLEPALRKHAEERNPDGVRFNHELVELSQGEAGVQAVIRDRGSGEDYGVTCDYLIGADGGKGVGAAVGIEMLGPPPLVRAVSVHFEADLSPYLTQDDSVIRLFSRPSLDGPPIMCGLLAMGPTWDRHSRQWALHVVLPIEGEAGEEIPVPRGGPEDVELIKAMLVLPDLEAEVIGASEWLIEAVVADRYQEGRVFVVGDAAHRHSPMGGLGLNTAIQDVHNLTWKLGHVLDGKASPALLESYDAERRPVGARNVSFSTGCFFRHLAANAGFAVPPGAPPEFTEAVLTALFADTEDGATRRAALEEFYAAVRYEFQCADIELGYEYAASPAIVADGSAAPPVDPTGHRLVQTGRPGHRLPHALLDDGDGARSTHTFLPTGSFLLLAGSEGAAWVEAAPQIASELGVAVAAYTVGSESTLKDPDGVWADLRGHGEAGAILVRPDGHVAFRSGNDEDAPAQLRDAFAAVLGVGAGARG
jgi:2,4-dichlorophenol 6-monooxygenase